MMYRKLTYLFCFLFVVNQAFTQEVAEKKWEKGFTAGGVFNRMTSVGLTTNNNNFSFTPTAPNERSWQFTYASGFTFGAFAKRLISEKLTMQGEFNVFLNRQEAVFKETPLPAQQNGFQFQNQVVNNGTVNFNTMYLQIPFLINLKLATATEFEMGLYFTQSLANNSTQNVEIKTLTKSNPQTGQLTILDPPIITSKLTPPDISGGIGWILGVNTDITDRFGVRFRYEGGLTGVADYQDLRENRMSVAIIYKIN
jgi:hypothetical protein